MRLANTRPIFYMAASVLSRQHEALHKLRADAADDARSLVDALQSELTRRQEEQRAMQARLSASERREATLKDEAVHLRAQLAQVRTDASAASRRERWEHRKREEAAAAATSKDAQAASEAEQQVRSEVARLAALLAERDRELASAKAQLRDQRHRKKEESLHERQESWLRRLNDTAKDSSKPPPTETQPPPKDEASRLLPLQEDFIARVNGGNRMR